MESIPVSAALLRSRLCSKPTVYDAADEAAWNSGERQTVAARKVPQIASANVGRSIERRFKRKWQRSPDRADDMRKKRAFGGCGAMPDNIRCFYTEGQRAALTVIVLEVKRYGYCDLAIETIAKRAGVRRTTVQNAVREARALGHIAVKLRPCPGKMNFTNIVTVTSNEWLVWIKRGPSRSQLSSGFKFLSSKEREDKKEAEAETLRPFNQAAPPEAATARGFGAR